jgi:AcrR family transcriptional regulator
MLSSSGARSSKARRRVGGFEASILRAARRLYFAEGMEGVTARRIARSVGCSPTAIYLYYRNLDDLLQHLRMEGHALLAGQLRSVDPALPAVDRVLAMGRAYYAFGVKHPRYYDLMFHARIAGPQRREAVQGEMSTLLLLRDVVTAGIERGEIRRDLDSTVLTNALWAQIHGVTSLAVSGLLLQTASGHHAEVLEAILASATASLHTA